MMIKKNRFQDNGDGYSIKDNAKIVTSQKKQINIAKPISVDFKEILKEAKKPKVNGQNHTVYIMHENFEKLEAYSKKYKLTKSKIISLLIETYLE